MQYTENYNFKKPEDEDTYDIQNENDNMDSIDFSLKDTLDTVAERLASALAVVNEKVTEITNYVNEKVAYILENLESLVISKVTEQMDVHKSDYNNPHNVTKAQVGLSDVVNTGDSAIPEIDGTQKFTTGGAYTYGAVQMVDGAANSDNVNKYNKVSSSNQLQRCYGGSSTYYLLKNGTIQNSLTFTSIQNYTYTAGTGVVSSGDCRFRVNKAPTAFTGYTKLHIKYKKTGTTAVTIYFQGFYVNAANEVINSGGISLATQEAAASSVVETSVALSSLIGQSNGLWIRINGTGVTLTDIWFAQDYVMENLVTTRNYNEAKGYGIQGYNLGYQALARVPVLFTTNTSTKHSRYIGTIRTATTPTSVTAGYIVETY